MNIQGPIFAIVTPFYDADLIDFMAFKEYLDFLYQSGVQTIIVNGTTGEFASMTIGERKSVLEFCRSHFKGSLLAHISACSVKDCVSLLQHASENDADGVIILPPFYYSNATYEGLLAFFQSVIDKTSIPVFLYNFPKHTNITLTPALLTALCEMNGQIQGVKDSSGDLDTAIGFKSAKPNIQVFVGNDSLAISALDKGLDGSVTGGGNPVPECLLKIRDAFAAGRTDSALKWQTILDDWRAYRKKLDILEISVAKAGLAARIPGFPVHVRPPLQSPSKEAVGSIAEHITTVVMSAITNASAG
ncbi:dihydrodipicolinate synthase family protein [Chloroflexota bacterium]